MAGQTLARYHALGGRVGECRGCKRASHRVTGIARERCRDVISRLGRGRSALDVAGGARARVHTGVVERGASGAGERHVTRVAGIARGRGGNVVRCFAERVPLGVRTAVTSAALTGQNSLRG